MSTDDERCAAHPDIAAVLDALHAVMAGGSAEVRILDAGGPGKSELDALLATSLDSLVKPKDTIAALVEAQVAISASRAGEERALTFFEAAVAALGEPVEDAYAALRTFVVYREAASNLAPSNEAPAALLRVKATCLKCLECAIAAMRQAWKVRRLMQLADDSELHPLSCAFECAALATGSQEERVEAFRRGGEALARIAGIGDEIRGLLAADASEPPESVRERLEEKAEETESQRRKVHEAIVSCGAVGVGQRHLLHLVDLLCSRLYQPPFLEISRPVLEPAGPWSVKVRRLAASIAEDLKPFGLPPLPPLLPWGNPQWAYEPNRGVVFFPDLDEQGEAILPFQAKLLGESDLDEAGRLMDDLAPLVLAHEIFHYARHACGALTDDFWYEEWAANRLSVAYSRKHNPVVVERLRPAMERLSAAHPEFLGERGRAILARLTAERPEVIEGGEGYEIGLPEMTAVQLELMEHLVSLPLVLAAEIQRLLPEMGRQA
ncbi:MAG: hypothetical protein ACOCVR_02950 [Myxococcota bacterium]